MESRQMMKKPLLQITVDEASKNNTDCESENIIAIKSSKSAVSDEGVGMQVIMCVATKSSPDTTETKYKHKVAKESVVVREGESPYLYDLETEIKEDGTWEDFHHIKHKHTPQSREAEQLWTIKDGRQEFPIKSSGFKINYQVEEMGEGRYKVTINKRADKVKIKEGLEADKGHGDNMVTIVIRKVEDKWKIE